MINIEWLMAIDKNCLQELSKTLEKDDIHKLVGWLSEKDDKIRYQALLMLQYRSLNFADVYPFWDEFEKKLTSDNSYQRSIGLMLISYNVRWDALNRFDDIINEYLDILHDEKPVTVRQCIQSLNNIIPYKQNLIPEITDKIINFDYSEIRDTMKKLVLYDILTVLAEINKIQKSVIIEKYILDTFASGVLDKKVMKLIASKMQ